MRFIHQLGTGTTLIQLIDKQEKLLSRLEILKLKLWFAGIQIPIGGIAGVYTPKKFRNQGYATKCLEYALHLQQKDGHCFSFLFGNLNYYKKFGYVPVMPWYGIYVHHGSWTSLPHEPIMHDYSPPDAETILRLYHQNARFRVGPIVRDPQTPIKPFYPTAWRNGGVIRTLKDRQRRLTGYVWHSHRDTQEFEVAEVGAENEISYGSILTYLLHESRRRLKDYFLAALPPDDTFSIYLKQFETKYVIHLKQSGRGLATMLNLKATCKMLEPVFCHRIRLTRTNLIPKVLTIVTEKERVNLNLSGSGTKAEMEIPFQKLTQLLFGYVSFEEATRIGGKSSLTLEIGDMLFPQLYAFTYLRDRY